VSSFANHEFRNLVADLMRGSGRFNIAQGAITTAQNIGAAVSNALAGLIVFHAGYSSAFPSLAGIACLGLALCFFYLPETAGPPPATPRQ